MRNWCYALCALVAAGCAFGHVPQPEPGMLGEMKVGIHRIEPYASQAPHKPAACRLPIQKFGMPPSNTRAIATIELLGDLPQDVDFWALLQRLACEQGADMLLVIHYSDEPTARGVTGYHVIADALVFKECPCDSAGKSAQPEQLPAR